jgi:hypothetical protein
MAVSTRELFIYGADIALIFTVHLRRAGSIGHVAPTGEIPVDEVGHLQPGKQFFDVVVLAHVLATTISLRALINSLLSRR